MTNILIIRAGDRAILRKPHPCGSFDWQVTRTGADIGLKCEGCGRRVMLAREEFERRLKTLVPDTASAEIVAVLEHGTKSDSDSGHAAC